MTHLSVLADKLLGQKAHTSQFKGVKFSTFVVGLGEAGGGERDHRAACRPAPAAGVPQEHERLHLLLVQLPVCTERERRLLPPYYSSPSGAERETPFTTILQLTVCGRETPFTILLSVAERLLTITCHPPLHSKKNTCKSVLQEGCPTLFLEVYYPAN